MLRDAECQGIGAKVELTSSALDATAKKLDKVETHVVSAMSKLGPEMEQAYSHLVWYAGRVHFWAFL